MKLRELGITIFPEYVQSEGVEAVIETLMDRLGATSVTTSPYVAASAAPGVGHREPPIDGGAGKARLLDRPLWGRQEVWMSAASSFVPEAKRYQGLAYQPPEVGALTHQDGPVIGAFLDTARDRGLEAWLQIQAAIPPGHRVQFGGPVADDQCLMPDGRTVPGRVDKNASLASDQLRRYMRAYVADLYDVYPQVTGFKFDWPEYPVYHFESLLFDFNPATARFAHPMGLRFDSLRRGCAAFLEELCNGAIRHRNIALDDLESFRSSLFAAYPVLADLIAWRSAIVTDYALFLRETLDEVSDGKCQLFLPCFPPPLNIVTGFDLPGIAPYSDVIGVKLYTMHWPMIENNYLHWLATRTSFAPAQIAMALSALLHLSPRQPRDPDTIRYPEPDEAHPADTADLLAKLALAKEQIADRSKMVGMAHAYGPTEDVIRRLQATAEGADGAVQVNRYCYLSEDKIDAIARLR